MHSLSISSPAEGNLLRFTSLCTITASFSYLFDVHSQEKLNAIYNEFYCKKLANYLRNLIRLPQAGMRLVYNFRHYLSSAD